jgi:glycosyltransferase involved in cell wall biosynthesis
MLVTLVVPLVSQQPHLFDLLRSVGAFFEGYQEAEVVLINQSGSSVYQSAINLTGLNVVEILTASVIPASSARNLGAQKASGEYLFFLDDDAYVNYEKNTLRELVSRLKEGVDMLICQRGEMRKGEYICHWNKNISKITQYNFSNTVIEWNIIIKKILFFDLGKFPNIGPGEQHAALCGESFILMANLFKSGGDVELFDMLKVSHPSMIKPNNKTESLLGYYYGAGYSLGTSLTKFTMSGRLYWLLRFLIAITLDLVYRYKRYEKTVPVSPKFLGLKLAKCRVIGFADGFFSRNIKDRKWLTLNA